MTKRIVLTIASDKEAATLLEDAANYPDSPLLTPCQENTVDAAIELDRRHIVVICGSLKYSIDIFEAAFYEWRKGNQVCGPTDHADHARRHREQIDLADELLVVHKPDGSLDDSTIAEMQYALTRRKPVRHWASLSGANQIAIAAKLEDEAPDIAAATARAQAAIHQQLDNA